MGRKFWDVKNVLTTLKAFVVSVIVGLVSWLIAFLAVKAPLVAGIMGVLWFILALWLWGYLANKWWKWK